MDDNNPMSDPDQWEADLERRYPPVEQGEQAVSEFRNYQAEVRVLEEKLRRATRGKEGHTQSMEQQIQAVPPLNIAGGRPIRLLKHL